MTEIDFAYFTSERVLSAYAQCLFPPGTGSRAGVGEHTASRRRLRLHGGQAMRTEAGDSAHDSEKDRGIQRGAGPVTRRRRPGWPLRCWRVPHWRAWAAGAAIRLRGCWRRTGRLPARDCGGPGAGPGRAPAAACLRRARDARGGHQRHRHHHRRHPPLRRTPGLPRTWTCTPARYGLPPARLKIISYGHRPGRHRPRRRRAHWAQEGIADVEMMHALAPDATLVYVAGPRCGPAAELYDQALSWVCHPRPAGRGELLLGHTGIGPGARQDQSGLQAAARAGVTVGGRHRGHRRPTRAGRQKACTRVSGSAVASF